jgi:hypothetical protein
MRHAGQTDVLPGILLATSDEFEAALSRLGINQTTFAVLTGMNRKTIYGWGNERTGSVCGARTR